MDNGGHYRTDYLAGHPSLHGRVLFTNAQPGDADAAFVEHNDALAATNVAEIQDLVRKGYVVRTRADADTVQARSERHDNARRRARERRAMGQHRLPGARVSPSMFGTDYVASIPDGHPARCNPVNTGPRCRNDRARTAAVTRGTAREYGTP